MHDKPPQEIVDNLEIIYRDKYTRKYKCKVCREESEHLHGRYELELFAKKHFHPEQKT